MSYANLFPVFYSTFTCQSDVCLSRVINFRIYLLREFQAKSSTMFVKRWAFSFYFFFLFRIPGRHLVLLEYFDSLSVIFLDFDDDSQSINKGKELNRCKKREFKGSIWIRVHQTRRNIFNVLTSTHAHTPTLYLSRIDSCVA